ncbi:MAG: radical SAM/SPASM domain-containing protein [Thermodesulfobacteriota bacterium]|nr:radical SAM/SPASM domain-containing protein [Thermodesulfobacteriota bacterium]
MIFPLNVILETSSLCNVSCLGCALHGSHACVTRSFGNMKKNIWDPVIKEIGSWDQKTTVTAHGGGEPLLNPELKDILCFAKSFDNIEVGFLTNGMLLDEAWAEFLTDQGIDWIALSIDGVDPDTHDRIRKKSDLIRVENNLQTLLEVKKRKKAAWPAVKLNMVAYDEIADQQDRFIDKWIDQVESVMISHYRNPPDSKRWPHVPKERKPCPLLWSQMVVAWDGRLGLCCEDFNIDFSLGRAGGKTSLVDLWNDKPFADVRNLHTAGRFDTHPMCRTCDTWAEDLERRTMYDPDRNCHVVTSPSQKAFYR